ncbi:3101_t:CDS:2 [Funneliformis caledonium]|uniref:3101_t:CDS:1 n=1 Tax=Funneliformis caledonium TaxID=1117310 RepID=A0A9N9FH99_9GLOM|nr:3101_t:CDS:2 [Funneliformis caledonium]
MSKNMIDLEKFETRILLLEKKAEIFIDIAYAKQQVQVTENASLQINLIHQQEPKVL